MATDFLIHAMTGEHIAPFEYNTEIEARKLLALHGGVDGIADSVARELSIKEISPMRAKRGDIVTIETEGEGMALAVVIGKYAFGAGAVGWAAAPRRSWRRAWSIP